MGIIKSYEEGSHTVLNALKYKEFAIGGRDPIIQKPIPSTIDSNIPESNQLSRRIDDLTRISRLLTRAEGLKYLSNETALNKVEINPINKRTGQPKSGVGRFLSQVGANLWNTTKVVGSTLAQVPLNGTGTHFVKGFAGKGRRTYLSGLPVAPHELVRSGKEVFVNNIAEYTGKENPGNTAIEGTALDSLIETSQLAGAGYTIPKNRNEKRVLSYGSEVKRVSSRDTFETNSRSELDKLVLTSTDIPGDGELPSYKLNVKQVNYLASAVSSQDKKTLQRPSDDIEEDTDFIKFNFRVITPSNTGGTALFFRAYLDSFSDGHQGQWNSIKYIGRGENFYTYGGYQRNVQFAFKIAAQTREELQPLYEKLNWLISTTAPTYNSGGTFMMGTLVKVNIGDYLVDTPGFISQVNLTWNTNYPWEVAAKYIDPKTQTEITDNTPQLPHVLDCSIAFTPIENFVPETGKIGYIANDDKLKAELTYNTLEA